MFIVTHNLFVEQNEMAQKLALKSIYVKEVELYIDIISQGYKYKKDFFNFFKKKKQLNIYKNGNKVGSVFYVKERIPQ